MSEIIGVDRYSIPTEQTKWCKTSSVDVVVVLVAGEIGDYAAYRGIGTPEWVMRFGDKISFDRANIHFCGQLEKEKYRE